MRAATILLTLLLAASAFAATTKRLDGDGKSVVRVAERTVTIDVKDAEAVAILKDLQKQCGVRNLMIDPQVKGTGTFLFRDVPCRQAWRIVLRSLGLDSVTYPSSVVTVGTKKQ
jgi:hypothetical protein